MTSHLSYLLANQVIETDSDSQSSTQLSSFPNSRTTSMSSVESTGQKRAPEWSPAPSLSTKRKIEFVTPVVS